MLLKIAQKIEGINDYLAFNCLGGPKLLKARHLVNIQKGCTSFFILILMYYFQNFTLRSFFYLALHGSYGILWVIKDLTFPDRNCLRSQTLCSSIILFVLLALYWFIPFCTISNTNISEISPLRLTTCTFSFVFGAFFMLASDAQKYYTLKYRPGLISEGLFALNRNTNYLGEILIYGAFAGVSENIWSWIGLISIWCTVFALNIVMKDVSLAKKKGFLTYYNNSYLILFKFTKSHIINFILYFFPIILFLFFLIF